MVNLKKATSLLLLQLKRKFLQLIQPIQLIEWAEKTISRQLLRMLEAREKGCTEARAMGGKEAGVEVLL